MVLIFLLLMYMHLSPLQNIESFRLNSEKKNLRDCHWLLANDWNFVEYRINKSNINGLLLLE